MTILITLNSILFLTLYCLLYSLINWITGATLSPAIHIQAWWFLAVVASVFTANFSVKRMLKKTLRENGWKLNSLIWFQMAFGAVFWTLGELIIRVGTLRAAESTVYDTKSVIVFGAYTLLCLIIMKISRDV